MTPGVVGPHGRYGAYTAQRLPGTRSVDPSPSWTAPQHDDARNPSYPLVLIKVMRFSGPTDDHLVRRLLAPPDLDDGVESLDYWHRRGRRLPWYRFAARREAVRMTTLWERRVGRPRCHSAHASLEARLSAGSLVARTRFGRWTRRCDVRRHGDPDDRVRDCHGRGRRAAERAPARALINDRRRPRGLLLGLPSRAGSTT